jgi:two-component system response regulator AtoC
MTRLLVVDDEVDLAQYLADELEAGGYQARVAHDGVEAVLAVLDGGIDGVVMDIRMPKLDGINALRLIRRVAPRTPVIMFTGQAGQGDMLESNRLGAFTCLVKPIVIQKLFDTLRQAVGVPAVAA